MDEKKIRCDVTFIMPENGAPGHHGFSEAFNENISPEEYAKQCEVSAMKANNSKSAQAQKVQITQHNDDGSFKRDEYGNLIYETVWVCEVYNGSNI